MLSDVPPKSPLPPSGESDETADIGHVPPFTHANRGTPESIGGFRILERIGEGGMGIVYKAEQREPVRRIVALKVIKLGMDTKEVVARFEAERQALAMMAHPNVAKVLDGGVTETGSPYFAMEFVPGVPLTDYCNQNKLTTRQRLELFIPVCNAVQHAHQKRIVHRDLKPSNVLVQMFDGKPVPKVIDFGIAKATNQSLTASTLFTQTGAMIGTPEYMSPEQAMTSGLDVDTRTDIYSLGVMLYELLTGTLPFDAKMLREAGMAGMAKIIRDTEPQKPSTRLITLSGDLISTTATQHRSDPKALKREIVGDLDWITLKAMEKDRTRRYETANGLATDIHRHLSDEPVLARPPTTSYRFSKFVRKHKTGVAAGTAVTAALLLAIFGTSIGLIQTRAALHRAETAESTATEEKKRVILAQTAAEKEARRATAANQFLQNMLSSAQPNEKQVGSEVKVVDVLDTMARALDRLKAQPELELDGRLTLASTFASLNLHKKAIDNFNRALEISRGLFGEMSEQSLNITAELLMSMAKQNLVADSEPIARRNVDAARRQLSDHHPVTRNALNSLGVVLSGLSQNDEAEKIFRGLIEETQIHGVEGDVKGRGRYYNNLSIAVKAKGQTVEAEQLQRRALELYKSEGQFGTRHTGEALYLLTDTLFEQGKFAEAKTTAAEAVEEYRKTLGELHPMTLAAKVFLMSIMEQTEDFAGALKTLRDIGALLSQANQNSLFGFEPHFSELMLHVGEDEAKVRATLAKSLDQLRKALTKDGTFKFFWTRPNIILGLRSDRVWKGPALQQQAQWVAFTGIVNRIAEDTPVDYLDWEKMTFKVEPWPPGQPVSHGGREELWTSPDPKPGIYLFSMNIPRRTGRPIREAQWMLVTPWELKLYRTSSMTNTQEKDWKALFASEPAERRKEPALGFEHLSMLYGGFGPLHRENGYALSATTKLDLPEGKFNFRLFADGQRRAYVDGKMLLDAWTSQPDSAFLTEEGNSPQSELRVEWNGSARLIVTMTPDSPIAQQMVTDAKGALEGLEFAEDVAIRDISDGKTTAATFRDRANARARLGRVRESIDDYVKATEMDPDDHFAWYTRACALAYLGEKDQYRETCKFMMEKFAHSEDAQTVDQVTKSGLLIPSAYSEPAAALKNFDRALAKGGQWVMWFQMGKALAEYRSGPDHFQAAEELIEAAQPKHAVIGVGGITCNLIRSMIAFRKGDTANANRYLNLAENSLNSLGNKPGVHDMGNGGIEDRMICEILRREAEAMIKGPTTAPAAP